ncbi:unnamed protein product, partial [Amoebophrya sp. A25]
PDLRKTSLCRLYTSASGCSKGSECRFAHGYEELRELFPSQPRQNENVLNAARNEEREQQDAAQQLSLVGERSGQASDQATHGGFDQLYSAARSALEQANTSRRASTASNATTHADIITFPSEVQVEHQGQQQQQEEISSTSMRGHLGTLLGSPQRPQRRQPRGTGAHQDPVWTHHGNRGAARAGRPRAATDPSGAGPSDAAVGASIAASTSLTAPYLAEQVQQ